MLNIELQYKYIKMRDILVVIINDFIKIYQDF